jgi:membrane protein implicated in regulation of membrane protease activity
MSVMWMWGILGLVLLGIEMMTGTLFILWFGISALILSALVWLMPDIGVSMQLFLYAILSLGSLFVWRHFYAQTDDDSRVGQSQGQEIGVVGTIINVVSPQKNGKIEFSQGVMGSRKWVATSDEALAVGQQAEIIAIEGNTLRVKLKV